MKLLKYNVVVIQLKEIDVLNEYMANIIIETNNLQNLCLNATEKSIRDKLKEEKEYFFNYTYTLGKRIKQKREYPITNLTKIEEISQIKSMQSRDYTKEQVKDILTNDFTYLTEYTKDLIRYFSEQNDPVTSHILLEYLIHLEEMN